MAITTGGTLNWAARIHGLAVGGQVLVSRAMHDLVADVLPVDVELLPVGAVASTVDGWPAEAC